ncbi:MAG: methyltransferase domain-containing protein [Rubrivivax sp.]
MEPIDLSAVRRLYKDGVNIIDHLRKQLGSQFNTEQLVEISYDIQAGSYVDYVEQQPEACQPYQAEVSRLVDAFISPGDSVVDVGTGEMTTLAPVARGCYHKAAQAYAIDISLSRLLVGQRYLHDKLPASLGEKIQPAVASLFRLPFADNSIDLLWTSHALEPNGGRELDALRELARVCRKRLVLFEPSYEHNSAAGRQRMERLGYIKDLPGAVARIPGLELEQTLRIATTENLLNPTYAYVIRKTGSAPRQPPTLHCPLSHGALEPRNGYFYSKHSLLAYPVIEGIPVLRVDKGISASILDTQDPS